MPRTMTRYLFDEVTVRDVKTVLCSSCGKRLHRAKTFMNTVNPWNKDPLTGLPRTADQIRSKLREEAAVWRREPETCIQCARKERDAA